MKDDGIDTMVFKIEYLGGHSLTLENKKRNQVPGESDPQVDVSGCNFVK